MRKYELTLIFLANLAKEELEKALEKIKKLVTEAGGKIGEIKEWGRKELAYPIIPKDKKLGKQKEGIYYLLNLELEGKEAKKIEEKIKLDLNILRHLMIRVKK